jgi:hypothetical protein
LLATHQRCQAIFHDERDGARFLKLLSESAQRFEAAVLCFGVRKGSEPSIDTNSDGMHCLAPPSRIEYPGAIYHVLSRGDRREAIFRSEADRKLFLDLLGLTCRRTGWQIHAYCLMDNHFHLVVETPRGNASADKKLTAFRELQAAIHRRFEAQLESHA